jgi:hypothetical protein
MNKGHATKLVGQRVRLQPPAKRSGLPVDDDWLIVEVTDVSATMEHADTKRVAIVGLDGIHSYFIDAARTTPTQKYGFLQLHVQVDIAAEGSVNVTPLPPPRAAIISPAPRPQVLIQYDIPFLWDNATIRIGEEQPFVVTNAGPPARNVIISSITIGEHHRAVFDEISAVHEGQPVLVTPNIEQNGKLYGGIFQRNLKVALQAFADRCGREGVKSVALPFSVDYRDFEGRKYMTTFELQVSGPMMSRVKVEKIGDGAS